MQFRLGKVCIFLARNYRKMCDPFETILDLRGMPRSDTQSPNNHPNQSIECAVDRLDMLSIRPLKNHNSRIDRSQLDRTDTFYILLRPSLRSHRGTDLLGTSRILNTQIK